MTKGCVCVLVIRIEELAEIHQVTTIHIIAVPRVENDPTCIPAEEDPLTDSFPLPPEHGKRPSFPKTKKPLSS